MILKEAKEKVFQKAQQENLLEKSVCVRAKVLSAEEAIGNPEEYDFPLLKGREKIVEANFQTHKGHAFSDMFGGFQGSLSDVLQMPLSNNYRRSLVVATLNAVTRYWGLIDQTVHCRDQQPKECAKRCVEYFSQRYPSIKKLTLIGFQPAMADAFLKTVELKILDLDPENIGKEKFGVMIEDGIKDLKKASQWGDGVLATGSSVVNGTIDQIMETAKGKKVIFYGVTIAAVSYWADLNRLCFVGDDL